MSRRKTVLPPAFEPTGLAVDEPLSTTGHPVARNGWVARVGETLRSRVIGLMGSSAAELGRLRAADIRVLVQELDTHQVELEQQNEELRLAQLALAESRDRLSDLYEFAPVGYLSVDAEGRIRESNLAAAELLGLPRQKLMDRRLSSFVAVADADSFHHYFARALTSEQKVGCELSVQPAQRKELPLRLRLESIRIRNAVPDPAGGALCQIALIDITQASQDRARLHQLNRGLEQAVAERTEDLSRSLASLRANEERLSLALDAGVMGTWTIDLEGRHAHCDERHERLYGRVPRPAGHSSDIWLASLHPEDRERMSTVMERVVSGADPVLAAEYRILWPDGSAHWLAVRGRLVRDARGRPTHLVGVEQDVDERKGLEMEVRQIADREQRRIGQEPHDDIQQRLTGLGLMAESLCDALGSRTAPEHALCSRLTQGISETADRVNRLSHGLVPLELEGDGLVVALMRLATSTDMPGVMACEFTHDLKLQVRDGFSATHLYRIAQEAITNALRHSGAARIGLSLRREGSCGVMTVEDDGSGLKSGSGDGRGLRIMAYRASLIGATLKVVNAGARGTRVTCTFPATEPASRSPARRPSR